MSDGLFGRDTHKENRELADKIKHWPLTIVDTKSGAKLTFDDKVQFLMWLDPFAIDDDFLGGTNNVDGIFNGRIDLNSWPFR